MIIHTCYTNISKCRIQENIATSGFMSAIINVRYEFKLSHFFKVAAYICSDLNFDRVSQKMIKCNPGVTKVNEAPCMIGSLHPIRLCKNVARPAAKNIELTIFDLMTYAYFHWLSE